MNQQYYQIEAIGTIRSCFSEKFGIPRQAGLAKDAQAEIHLAREFSRQEMVRDLEQFSHIWVHFIFHKTLKAGWRPTIRPPGLGGQKRVGVFASRSPHRPNHLGFSAVILDRIEEIKQEGIVLHIRGGDFLDGTPVVDIKPYIPYCDAIGDALSGYSGRLSERLQIEFCREADYFCEQYEKRTGRKLKKIIEQVLINDPRPASQHERKQDFGMLLWDINIRWKVANGVVQVLSCIPVA